MMHVMKSEWIPWLANTFWHSPNTLRLEKANSKTSSESFWVLWRFRLLLLNLHWLVLNQGSAVILETSWKWLHSLTKYADMVFFLWQKNAAKKKIKIIILLMLSFVKRWRHHGYYTFLATKFWYHLVHFDSILTLILMYCIVLSVCALSHINFLCVASVNHSSRRHAAPPLAPELEL